MKQEITAPDVKPITNDTLIEDCYEAQSFIMKTARKEERKISRRELKIILNVVRCIRNVSKGDKGKKTVKIITVAPKDPEFSYNTNF